MRPGKTMESFYVWFRLGSSGSCLLIGGPKVKSSRTTATSRWLLSGRDNDQMGPMGRMGLMGRMGRMGPMGPMGPIRPISPIGPIGPILPQSFVEEFNHRAIVGFLVLTGGGGKVSAG